MACGYGACYGCVVEFDGELEAALRRGAGACGRCVLLNASRLPRRADGAGGRARARRLRDEDGHARAAAGEPAAADRRDRLRDAQLDRPANPGRRRASSARALPRLRASSSVPLWVSVGGFSAREYAETCARLDARRGRGVRAQPLLPERRRGAGDGGRDRRAPPRGDREAALREALAALPGTSARSARAVEAAGATGCRSSTRCAGSRSTTHAASRALLAARRRLLRARPEAGRARGRLRVRDAQRRCRSSAWAVSRPDATRSS